ncbi:tRNA-dihydrouridine synthase [Paenibacillus sp. NRS-1760]|uniref:tRNA-dihydrouridine synthase n=1 Tax=Paenibacillus sp. NRS-1760 TaxID=3233902 RepID=UPI003D29266A
MIKDVKVAASIPVIGNGDVFSPEDAKKLLEHTGRDPMVAILENYVHSLGEDEEFQAVSAVSAKKRVLQK